MRNPTISVRKAHSLKEELWLDSKGKWGSFKGRKRFKTDDAAEAFVQLHFGHDFHQFGTFPNS